MIALKDAVASVAIIAMIAAAALTGPAIPTDGRLEQIIVPAPTRGPHPSITCPAGAVNISPGSSIQTAVDGNPGATTFCLLAGVHSITNEIVPKTGNTFVGQYGAIIDGSGWSTGDLDDAAFKAVSVDVDNVTIRNLVIRAMPRYGIQAAKDFTNNWVVEYNEITRTVTGVSVATGSVVRHNVIHRNVGIVDDPDPALRGGGYLVYLSSNVTFDNNEIAYNGAEQKFGDSSAIIFRNNYVHHNVYAGFWTDGASNILVENNTTEANQFGVYYEVSELGTIRNNIVRNNTENGFFISTGKTVEITGNTIDRNAFGVELFIHCDRIGESHPGFTADLSNVNVHHNTFTTLEGSGHWAAMGTSSACDAGEIDPYYVSMTKSLTFDFNTYSAGQASPFQWNAVNKTWAGWQAIPQDPNGTFQ